MAITRARRHLALIGDSDTLNHEPFIKGLLAYCSDHGEVWSGHDYLNGQFIHVLACKVSQLKSICFHLRPPIAPEASLRKCLSLNQLEKIFVAIGIWGDKHVAD